MGRDPWVTSNERDFEDLDGLRVEDWRSQPSLQARFAIEVPPVGEQPRLARRSMAPCTTCIHARVSYLRRQSSRSLSLDTTTTGDNDRFDGRSRQRSQATMTTMVVPRPRVAGRQ
jgi:hypothetical protein